MKADVGMELVAVLARIGKEDRELYRQLRAEAWGIVERKHAEQTPEMRAAWIKGSS